MWSNHGRYGGVGRHTAPRAHSGCTGSLRSSTQSYHFEEDSLSTHFFDKKYLSSIFDRPGSDVTHLRITD